MTILIEQTHELTNRVKADLGLACLLAHQDQLKSYLSSQA